MPEQNLQFIIGLYLGLLDRMPDENGLKAWAAAMDQGATREHIVQAFLDSNEFAARSGTTNTKEIIETLYSNAFDRPADEQGLTAWSDAVAHGAPLPQIISRILAVADDTRNLDGQRLANAIQSVMTTRDTAVRLGVDQYWQGAEVDGITNDPISMTQQDAIEQVRLGAKVPLAAQVRVDNVIDGNKIDALVLDGTNLNDLIILGPKALSVFARDGDDHVQGSDLGTMFWPGNGNDTVEAGAGADIIDARPDAPASVRDVFYGQDGDDVIFGGMGNEFIDGGDGKDFISAGGGNDTVRGGIGHDEILKDGGGNFNILGEAGDDKITVRNAATNTGIINGGAGNDIIDVDNVYSLSIYAGTGDDTATIKNIEHGGYVFMEDGNDTLTGTGVKSMNIDMGVGNNTVNLDGVSSTTITMGAGADHVVLRHASNVTVILGDGNDTIEIYDSDNVVVQGNRGNDSVRIVNSTNINADGGYIEANQFYVDTKSLNSNSLKLIGSPDVEKVAQSSLVITDLKNGDKITLNQDNFSYFYELKFDYDVRARINFEKNKNFGNETYYEGVIKNINGNETALRSDIWFIQGNKPFKERDNIFYGSVSPGEWRVLNNGVEVGWIDNQSARLFFDDVPKVYRPYVLDGNLMYSWVL